MTLLGGADEDRFRVAGSRLPISATTTILGDDDVDTSIDLLEFDPAGGDLEPQPPLAQIDGNVQVVDQGLLTYQTIGIVSAITPPVIRFVTVPESDPAVPELTESYTISEGQGVNVAVDVTLPQAGVGLVGVDWDIDGDGNFNDAIGESISLSWAQLRDLGLGDDGIYRIAARALDQADRQSVEFATLVIDNVSPAAQVSPAGNAQVGIPYPIEFSSFDPGQDEVTSWRVNWGDGIEEVYGSNSVSASHTYLDAGVFEIQVEVTDDDDARNLVTTSVTVTPAMAQSQSTFSITEGQALRLDANAIGNATLSWDLNGDGDFSDASGQTPLVSWAALQALTPPINDDGSYPIRVRSTYSDGSSADATATLIVTNIAPTATLVHDGAAAKEGDAVRVSLIGADDVAAGDVADGFRYYFDLNNDGLFEIGPQDEPFADLVVTDSGLRTITARIEDDKDFRQYQTSFAVTEVAPELNVEVVDDSGNVLDPALQPLEGQAYRLRLSATDPGDDRITTWIVSWGDGTSQTIEADTAIVNNTYRDDGDYRVVIAAYDEDGEYSLEKSVSVQNVAPTISFTPPAQVNEGESFEILLESTDPGDDVIDRWEIDWGDGSEIETIDGGLRRASHVYLDAAEAGTEFGVRVTGYDEGTAAVSETQIIRVRNVAPTATLSVSQSDLVEGGQVTLTIGSPVDPGNDTVTEYVIDWGDGQQQTIPAPQPTTASDGSERIPPVRLQHVYTDGDATRIIRVTAGDEDGQFLLDQQLQVRVANVAPTLLVSGTDRVTQGQAYALLLGQAEDPGEDTVFEYRVDWGDGSAEESYPSPGLVTHVYDTGASRIIMITLVDEDGASRDDQRGVRQFRSPRGGRRGCDPRGRFHPNRLDRERSGSRRRSSW